MKDRSALRLAHRIDHNHQTLVPPRREVGACGMTQMMAHLVNPFGGILGIVPVYLREQRLLRENFLVERRAGLIEAENLAERRVVEAMRNLINLRQRQTGLLK